MSQDVESEGRTQRVGRLLGELEKHLILVPGANEILFGLREAISEIEDERADFQRLFDLQEKRMRIAVAMWRAESPKERELSLPDLGTLLGWLLDKIHSYRAIVSAQDSMIGSLRGNIQFLMFLPGPPPDSLRDAVPANRPWIVSKFWSVLHNAVAHPLMEVLPEDFGERLHKWTESRM